MFTRIIFVLCLAFMSSGAFADDVFGNQQFVRLGTKTIGSGDTAQKVLDAGGEPDTRTDLINKFGVKLGEDWTYGTGARSTTVIRVERGYVVAVWTTLK